MLRQIGLCLNNRIARPMCACGRVAALMLLTGLACAAFAADSASAASPHVISTAQTSRCAVCHSTHAAKNSLLLRTREASGSVSNSCLACHDGSDTTASNVASGSADSFGQASGHSLSIESSGTVRLEGCSTCHQVHGASSDSRMIPSKKINKVVVTSAGKDLCLACHASNAAWFGPDYPETSAPTRDATGYPIAGTWPGESTYASASANAHSRIPETTRTVGVSEPVRREQGDCLYCHASHGGANAYDGLLTTYTVPAQATLASDQADGSYAALCFTCHGANKPSGFATAPVDIKQFATASGGAGGHSIVTSGGTLPVGAPLPCFECHNPHGSKLDNGSLISDERGESLATTNDAGVRAFCFTCHTTSDTIRGWDSAATEPTYTPVVSAGTTELVVGIPRDGGVLRLPATVGTQTAGHAQDDSASCYDCHGQSYAGGGRNVHNPGSGEPVSFAPALASVPDWSTVPSVPVDATGSPEATASAVATQSVVASDPAGLPVQPAWPESLKLGLDATGSADTTIATPTP